MNIGAVLIGDELMSGKREDAHFAHLQQVLAERGLELSWSLMVGDDAEQLERALQFSMSSDDLVFCFGGIGATPDDRTRQTAAKVSQQNLIRHPQAVACIEQQYGEAAYPKRILMGELPEHSTIIPNVINNVPGFSLGDHHFMPGFPEMSWPMVDWLLETKYKDLKHLAPPFEKIISIPDARESDLIDVMNQILDAFPTLKLSSLPKLGAQPYIEFSLRGDQQAVDQAMALMISALESQQLSWQAI
jgi:molybdopterin-biosynthesis enzyme MoeA-like protein